MRTFRTITAALICMITVSACQEKFEKYYDLAVDSLGYTLPYTGETFPLYVYCSNDWQAAFDEEADWIKIEPGTEKGSGNGLVRITYKDNDDAPRSINLVITSGEFSKVVKLDQNYNSTHLEIK